MRVERCANCSRKSGRCRDCAASTASSINSSACLDIDTERFALPRGTVGRGDDPVFILCIDEREKRRVSSCEPLLSSNPTGESQCESIARQYFVANSPTVGDAANLSPSQPETSTFRVQVR